MGHLLPLRTKLAFGVGASAEGAINVAFNTWNFLFDGPIAALPALGAIWCYRQYTLDRHSQVQQELEQRRAAHAPRVDEHTEAPAVNAILSG